MNLAGNLNLHPTKTQIYYVIDFISYPKGKYFMIFYVKDVHLGTSLSFKKSKSHYLVFKFYTGFDWHTGKVPFTFSQRNVPSLTSYTVNLMCTYIISYLSSSKSKISKDEYLLFEPIMSQLSSTILKEATRISN